MRTFSEDGRRIRLRPATVLTQPLLAECQQYGIPSDLDTLRAHAGKIVGAAVVRWHGRYDPRALSMLLEHRIYRDFSVSLEADPKQVGFLEVLHVEKMPQPVQPLWESQGRRAWGKGIVFDKIMICCDQSARVFEEVFGVGTSRT